MAALYCDDPRPASAGRGRPEVRTTGACGAIWARRVATPTEPLGSWPDAPQNGRNAPLGRPGPLVRQEPADTGSIVQPTPPTAPASGLVLVMRLMPFNAWTEIDDLFEGRFMERFAPGSLLRTMVEDRDEIRSLFQHGRDPSIGAKPLGPILTLEERADGAYAEVPLLDASYVADLVPGIDAGLYGVSIRFSVVREEFRRRPTPSDYNPEGIPERTVTEARLYEFGPVTFPAYKTTQANLG